MRRHTSEDSGRSDRTVVSEDPVRIRVDVELDGDRLELLLDGSVSVVEVREP